MNNDDLTSKEIFKKLVENGPLKTDMTIFKMLILSFLAGIYISFGGELYIMATQDVKIGSSFSQFLGGSVFSIGLMLVVIAGGELFTGNNLLIIPLLSRKINLKGFFKNLFFVYSGNLIGSIIFAFITFLSGIYKYNNFEWGYRAVLIANSKVNLTFFEALSKGILCNILVCLAIWMATGSKNIISKIFSIYFPITAFVMSGFEHSVANMFLIPIGIIIKNNETLSSKLVNIDIFNLNWANFFIKNLIPVTIGNIIGGMFFVGFLYYLVYLKD
ncbi:MAG: formate/nitrite transporter family protein [Caldisericia bacterium]